MFVISAVIIVIIKKFKDSVRRHAKYFFSGHTNNDFLIFSKGRVKRIWIYPYFSGWVVQERVKIFFSFLGGSQTRHWIKQQPMTASAIATHHYCCHHPPLPTSDAHCYYPPPASTTATTHHGGRQWWVVAVGYVSGWWWWWGLVVDMSSGWQW